jgi:hypothetical protein
MKDQTLYFKDNFFSKGRTEIFNQTKGKVGELDLKSAFSSSVDVLDNDGNLVMTGKFGFFSNKWRISDSSGVEVGVLKQKLSLLSKKFEYDSNGRGILSILAEAFSRQYEIFDEQSRLIARFERVSGFFSSPAFQLTNYHEKFPTEELIAVVMGINAIQQRNNSAAAGG